MQMRYETNSRQYLNVPGNPLIYWCNDFSIFSFPKLYEQYVSGGRNKTHNNELFLRNWWEISSSRKWKPYANGGDYRRWYGNNNNLVDWSDEARSFYDKHGGLYNEQFWNKSGICWSLIASCKNSFRLKDAIFHYSSASPTIISNNKDLDLAVLGFLNSKVTTYLLNMFNPTLNTTVSDVLNLPFKCFDSKAIALNVDRNINYAKKDWDSFETSWDFKKHPLI